MCALAGYLPGLTPFGAIEGDSSACSTLVVWAIAAICLGFGLPRGFGLGLLGMLLKHATGIVIWCGLFWGC